MMKPVWGIVLGVLLMSADVSILRAQGVSKPAITGLIDMQSIGWHNTDTGEPTFTLANVEHFPALFGGIVINATWRTMQPSPRGPVDFHPVEAALMQIRAYNVAHPEAPLGAKLRIFAGDAAPLWAKQLAGGPVSLVRNPQGCPSPPCPITIGKVWDSEYIAAWRAFQRAVAAQYDADPTIRSVSVTSCATQTDEPFIASLDPAARKNLIAAGYTVAKGKACVLGAIEDYAAWKRTPIDYTVNTFGNDSAFSVSVMRACRAALGERCELGNHELSADLLPQITAIIGPMSNLGAPIHYQTRAPARMGDWLATVATGIRYHATAIELWPDARLKGFMTLSVETVTALRDQFAESRSAPKRPQ